MHLFATVPARILILVATVGVLAAAIFREPIAMVWLGSMLAGMTVTRAAAGFKISRARRLGFEMYLKSGIRRLDIIREEHFSLDIVLRNRSDAALHLRDFRVLSSPSISMSVSADDALLEANSNLELTLAGVAARAGYLAVHGISLRVAHASGAFETPLIFINPVQIVVVPASLRRAARPSLGGLSRRPSDAERTGHMSGDSVELRELRAHQPGDALRKIAWKASAKRGTLLVRDEELMERQSIWLLLDASMELWAGELGRSPLDEGLDSVASVLKKYVSLGDHVGLGIVAARVLAWIPPASGAAHLTRLKQALLKSAQLWDADRSGFDENDVARVVLEHMARLDPKAAHRLAPTRLDPIALAALAITQRLEFETPEVFAPAPREKTLREYAATFGLSSPLRLELERGRSDAQLLAAIERCVSDRPSRIIIGSVEPSARLLEGIASLRRRLAYHRIRMSWLRFDPIAGLPEPSTEIHEVVNDSIRWRTADSYVNHVAKLKQLGIGVERVAEPRVQLRRTENS